ncbi:MAG: hypothetical protein DRP35_04065 [Candidatus Zixiibacteriota bacterium]|nr:MAG: hypothetical protein DRP35_04065 [candidate division Zixibacteria bacterium]
MKSVPVLIIFLILICFTVSFSQEALPNNIDSISSVESNIIYNSDGSQLYPMTSERKEKLISYSKFKNSWRFIAFFLNIFILGIILFTSLSAKLRTWAQIAKKKFFIVWLFLIFLLLTDYLFNLPFNIYRNFIVETNYGFMNQSVWGWLGEDLLSLLVTAIFGIIPFWFLYLTIERLKKWWLWFAGGAIPFIILSIVIAPVFISPLFNDFNELEDKQLESEILTLASKAGIEGSNVFQVNASKQSSKINAYVTGLFNTKRIVLYDTMIDNFSYDEIKFVMGHEMGHYVLHHIWKTVPLIILMLIFVLWFTNKTIHAVINKFKKRFKFEKLSDIASMPLILIYISVISFFTNPVINTLSRHHEHEADTYGMEISEVDGETAAIAFDKLSVFNLSDPDPHPVIEFWFYSHPSLTKRMEFVRSYK